MGSNNKNGQTGPIFFFLKLTSSNKNITQVVKTEEYQIASSYTQTKDQILANNISIPLLKSACRFRFHASQHYPQSYNTMKPKKPLNQHKEKMVKNLFQRAMKHSAGKSCPTGSHSVNAVKHIPCSENKKQGTYSIHCF